MDYKIDYKNIYMPQYYLYPTHPQILHQLVVELFTRVEKFSPIEESFFSILSSWPIYRVGGDLATQRKSIAQSHPPFSKVILLSFAKLADDVAWITTTHTWFHSYFWIQPVAVDEYAQWFIQSASVFSMYAKPIEAQIPFIRAYVNCQIVPYIINVYTSQEKFDDIVDTILAHHWNDTCVCVIYQEEIWPAIEEKWSMYMESLG